MDSEVPAVPVEQPVELEQPVEPAAVEPVAPSSEVAVESPVEVQQPDAPVEVQASASVEVAAQQAAEVAAPQPAVPKSQSSHLAHPNNLKVTSRHVQVVLDAIQQISEGRKLTPALLLRLAVHSLTLANNMKLAKVDQSDLLTHSLEQYIQVQVTNGELSQDEANDLKDLVASTVEGVMYTAVNTKKSCCVIC